MQKDVFYAQDARRKGSTELDFGGWWFDGEPSDVWSPRYRISWIERTGEFYAVSHRTRDIELLGYAATEQEADAILEGWGKVCGQPASMSWVRAAFA